MNEQAWDLYPPVWIGERVLPCTQSSSAPHPNPSTLVLLQARTLHNGHQLFCTGTPQVFPNEAEAARVLHHFILGTELVVTLNSDDPAYFGGYLLDNYRLVQRLLDLGVPQVRGSVEVVWCVNSTLLLWWWCYLLDNYHPLLRLRSEPRCTAGGCEL